MKKKRGPPFKPPELVKTPACFKISSWILEWMRTQDQSQSTLIEEALTEKHGLVPPTPKVKKP